LSMVFASRSDPLLAHQRLCMVCSSIVVAWQMCFHLSRSLITLIGICSEKIHGESRASPRWHAECTTIDRLQCSPVFLKLSLPCAKLWSAAEVYDLVAVSKHIGSLGGGQILSPQRACHVLDTLYTWYFWTRIDLFCLAKDTTLLSPGRPSTERPPTSLICKCLDEFNWVGQVAWINYKL
jgi:hypothetical protein